MKTVAALVFVLAAITQLLACALKREKLRKCTKPLLMPLLTAVYWLWSKNANALVIAALLCGCAGDTFLLFPFHPPLFAAGAGMFAAGHICYYIALLELHPLSAPVWAIILIAAVFLFAVAVIYKKLMPELPKLLKIGALVYMLLLAGLGALTLICLAGSAAASTALLFAGAMMFIISDSLLALGTFIVKMETPKRNLAVMSTYIAAQVLLAIGFIL